MRTNIDIDDKLMQEAMRFSGAETKKAAVETALAFYVKLKSQAVALRALRGSVQWEGDLEQSRLGRIEE
jgi:Arc/MetJ family transcription regulator